MTVTRSSWCREMAWLYCRKSPLYLYGFDTHLVNLSCHPVHLLAPAACSCSPGVSRHPCGAPLGHRSASSSPKQGPAATQSGQAQGDRSDAAPLLQVRSRAGECRCRGTLGSKSALSALWSPCRSGAYHKARLCCLRENRATAARGGTDRKKLVGWTIFQVGIRVLLWTRP